MAGGLTPRKIEIERDLETETFRIRGFDREGNRKIMVVPRYEIEEGIWDERRLQDEVQYNLQIAQRKMQAEMEREMAMASVYTNNTAWWDSTTTGTSTATTSNWITYNKPGRGGFVDEAFQFQKQAGIGSKPRKPKDFLTELRLELNDFIRDALD